MDEYNVEIGILKVHNLPFTRVDAQFRLEGLDYTLSLIIDYDL